MIKYKMVMAGGLGLSWEYNFHQPSDGMALEYAKRIFETDQAARQSLFLDVFNMETQMSVARLVLDKPTARVQGQT